MAKTHPKTRKNRFADVSITRTDAVPAVPPSKEMTYQILIRLLRPVAERAAELGLSEQDFMDAAKQAY